MHRQSASKSLRGFARLRVALYRVDDALNGVFGGGAPLVGRRRRVERHQAECVLGQGFAQFGGFLKVRHDKMRYARLHQCVNDWHCAVPVGVRFDHRPQHALRANILFHDARVVAQRVQVQFQPIRSELLH
jgi:hypothetical protein